MSVKDDSVTEVREILSGITGSDKIPTSMITSSLDQSLVPDRDGNLPGSLGYSDTYDVYYAAYLTSNYLKSVPAVTNASSEGTSVTVTPGDIKGLQDYLASVSPILKHQPYVLRCVPIPDDRAYSRTDMNRAGDSDVDSDLG